VKRFLIIGLALWLAGTVVLRLAPGHLLRPDRTLATVALYGGSFLVMFTLIRWRVLPRLGSPEAAVAVIGLVLPTLVLDAFSSAFFPAVFPNFSAGAAGIFGGWMLICCGGALTAVLAAR
jgi:hypothetical protein